MVVLYTYLNPRRVKATERDFTAKTVSSSAHLIMTFDFKLERGCFLVLQKPSLFSYCVLVWVLFVVF